MQHECSTHHSAGLCSVLRQLKRHLDMALGAQIVYLVRLCQPATQQALSVCYSFIVLGRHPKARHSIAKMHMRTPDFDFQTLLWEDRATRLSSRSVRPCTDAFGKLRRIESVSRSCAMHGVCLRLAYSIQRTTEAELRIPEDVTKAAKVEQVCTTHTKPVQILCSLSAHAGAHLIWVHLCIAKMRCMLGLAQIRSRLPKQVKQP